MEDITRGQLLFVMLFIIILAIIIAYIVYKIKIYQLKKQHYSTYGAKQFLSYIDIFMHTLLIIIGICLCTSLILVVIEQWNVPL